MEFKHYVYVAILTLGVIGLIIVAILSKPPEIQNSNSYQPIGGTIR